MQSINVTNHNYPHQFSYEYDENQNHIGNLFDTQDSVIGEFPAFTGTIKVIDSDGMIVSADYVNGDYHGTITITTKVAIGKNGNKYQNMEFRPRKGILNGNAISKHDLKGKTHHYTVYGDVIMDIDQFMAKGLFGMMNAALYSHFDDDGNEVFNVGSQSTATKDEVIEWIKKNYDNVDEANFNLQDYADSIYFMKLELGTK